MAGRMEPANTAQYIQKSGEWCHGSPFPKLKKLVLKISVTRSGCRKNKATQVMVLIEVLSFRVTTLKASWATWACCELQTSSSGSHN